MTADEYPPLAALDARVRGLLEEKRRLQTAQRLRRGNFAERIAVLAGQIDEAEEREDAIKREVCVAAWLGRALYAAARMPLPMRKEG